MINRRALIQRTAGTLFATGLIPSIGWSATTLNWGHSRIDALSDGHPVLPRSMTLGQMPEGPVSDILSRYGISQRTKTWY